MNNLINWISDWYSQQCDGDWEHIHIINIENLDNPGWKLNVDLEDTVLDDIIIHYQLKELEGGEWYGFKAEKNKFIAIGSVMQLEQLLLVFKDFAEGKLEQHYVSKK